METKCTGIMGCIFGHKWIPLNAKSAWKIGMPFMKACTHLSPGDLATLLNGSRIACRRCGAVTGAKP